MAQLLQDPPSFDAVIQADTGDLDEILHVTDALYQQLVDRARASRSRTDRPDPALRSLAEDVLFAEARVLDMRQYDAWLEMFTADCIYWVPTTQHVSDPRLVTSIHLDDRRRLRDRIALIKTGFLHAQSPTSRTCRIVSNVEAWPGPPGPGSLVVRSNLTTWTHRHQRTEQHAGWQEHTLVPAPGGIGYLIQYKTLHLLDSDSPQGNITFIL